MSTEFHTETGPFTQVPLPGDRSSLVWVVKPETPKNWRLWTMPTLSRRVERTHAVDARPRDGRAGAAGLSAVGRLAGAFCQEPRRVGRRSRPYLPADRRAGLEPRHQGRRRNCSNRSENRDDPGSEPPSRLTIAAAGRTSWRAPARSTFSTCRCCRTCCRRKWCAAPGSAVLGALCAAAGILHARGTAARQRLRSVFSSYGNRSGGSIPLLIM